MTLRSKTLLALGTTFVVLLVVVYMVSSMALLRGFARLEDESLRRSMDAVERALAAETQAVAEAAERWSPGGAGEALTGAADFIALVDPQRTVTLAASRIADPAVAASLTGELEALVRADPDLVRHAYGDSRKTGIAVLPSCPVLLCSRPARAPRASGVVIAGRLLDAEAVARLGTEAQTSLSVRPWGAAGLPPDFASAARELGRGARTVVRPLAGGWVAAYRVVEGIDRRAAVILRSDAPRSILAQGRASQTYLMAALLLAAIVFAAVPLLVVERTVLRRLVWLTGGVEAIAASRSAAARVQVKGKDELADLASRINEMLAALERAQGERGESEARYRAVFEQAGDAIVLFDATSGKVVDANRAAARFLDFGPGELLDREILDLVAEDPATVAAHIADVQREHRVYGGERTFRRKDGTWVHGEVTSSVVAMRGRDVVCSVVRDTSERRLLEERLRQSQKLEAVGRLAAGVAHDFNNLLQAIVAAVGVLQTRGDDREARERATDALDAQVTSGAALTRQLLLIARQEEFSAISFDLNELIGEIGGFMRRVVRENIRFEVELAEGSLPAFGDRSRLEQSVINLVANASDAMPAGGRLSIATGRRDGRVWFEVSDSGPGVTAEVREQMFEPFFTTRDRTRHAGLGLTVVKGIVEEHGGEIAVTSSPESGMAVRVTLPVVAGEEREGEVVAAPAPPAGAATGGRVLLVEDGEAIRRGLAEVLGVLGYEVTAVGSGEEAVALADAGEMRVLLTDYMLPGMDGAELARTLLGRRPGLRVIVMSGYAVEETVLALVGSPGVRFLAKPFGMETLARELHAAFTDSAGQGAQVSRSNR